MSIFDLIKPYLKQQNLTDEQIDKIEKEAFREKQSRNQPEWMHEHEILRNKSNEWINKVKELVTYAQKEEFEKIQLEEMPIEPIDIDGYYYYLVSILRELYPYRQHFEVISILHKALHTVIEKQDILKEGLILTEMRRQKAYNHNNEVENLKERATEEINKIKWDSFNNDYSSIDFLYNKALKEKNPS